MTKIGDIPRWNRFEVVLEGPSDGNPFTDSPLSAVFAHGNRKLEIEGFYDGEGIYRIRFMPDQTGTWTWRTRSPRSELDALSGVFECTEAEAGIRGPVRIGSPRRFAYEDGTEYRPFGTTCYAWTSQGVELERRTLATLASSPFNKIRMCVFPKHYDFNANEPPRYPFEGSREAGWDFSRFDPVFFRRFESLVEKLMDLGIEADIILFHPYDRWGFADMGAETDERYLRYLISRLAVYRNVWWSLANEYDLMPYKTISDWDRLFRIVQERDPHQHLRSIHNCRPFYDHGKPWVTHCSVQHNDVSLVSEWMALYGKPVVVDECKYEGNLPHRWGNITAEEMTHRFWEGFARGAYIGHGETYLRPLDEIWWSKGGELIGKSPERIAFLRRIMEEAPEGVLEGANLGRQVHAVSGVRDEYFIVYLGMSQAAYVELALPGGSVYTIEIIDGWNMTVIKAPGEYSGACRVDLFCSTHTSLRVRKLR